MTPRAPRQWNPLRRVILAGLGVLLLLAGVALAAVTEQGLIGSRAATDRHGEQILDLGTHGEPLASMQGRVVRVSGPVTVDEAPLDAEFNQQASTPLLLRQVAMFQWHRLEMGGPPIYEQDWENHPVDSRGFGAGRVNPGAFPVLPKEFDAAQVRVGAFVLSRVIQRALPGSVPVTPDMHRLPPNLAASFSLYDDALVTSAKPDHPRIGDLRVSWTAVPTGVVTIVARLDGNRLVPAADAVGGKRFVVAVGDCPLANLVPELPAPHEFAWARRVLSLLLAAAGAGLLLLSRQWPGRFVAGLAPTIGLAVVGGVSGVLWLGHDGRIAAMWLALAVAGAALAAWLARGQGRA